ncbi:hypothetical protein SAMN04489760_12210 [Syntrophus gentianae]|uniref:Uncharacterized protein n=1 Tax=Syntrophus gentianae TaxID=43775 RepID=A0A1H7ZC36_9BACT|nr:hypothetical protein [Syntrophus gentianae]SEM55781.1 hypothetical protein SAMN04489760_12210 [Syntrophus gentianae]
MRSCRKEIRTIPLLLAISVIFSLSVGNGCAQENSLSRGPFQTRIDLRPTVSAPENQGDKHLLLPKDIPDSDIFPPSSAPEERNREQEQALGAYGWGFFSLSLSNLDNKQHRRDISGKIVEIDRLDMFRSLTSGFSDLSSRKRLQYFGEILEPEVKLKIEF